ncbi:hypothetical protein V2J09_021874 [Rumex salicifolius]
MSGASVAYSSCRKLQICASPNLLNLSVASFFPAEFRRKLSQHTYTSTRLRLWLFVKFRCTDNYGVTDSLMLTCARDIMAAMLVSALLKTFSNGVSLKIIFLSSFFFIFMRF